VVQEDDEEIRVRVKIKQGEVNMESVARVDVPADANILHALAIADVLNPVAQESVSLADILVGVK
jgi:hypothetical protein